MNRGYHYQQTLYIYGNHWVPGNLFKGQNITVDANKSAAQLRNSGKISNCGLKGEEM